MIIYGNNIDVVPGGANRIVIHLNQYDDDFRLDFTLFARTGQLVLEEGTTAAIRGTKPDGNGFSADADIDIEHNTVSVYGDQQMTVVAGYSLYELTLYKDGKELNTSNFALSIERAPLDKDTPASRSQTRELVEIEAHALDIISAAEGVTAAAETVTSLSGTIAENAQIASNAASEAARISAALPDRQTFEDFVIEQQLMAEIIPETVQTYAKDANGKLSQVTHTKNGTVVRTDIFTYAAGSVTEERTLSSGHKLTKVTNLSTLETTITRTNPLV